MEDLTTPPLPLANWSWKRGLYVVFGLGCVSLGVLGVLLPVLPTTPFLLLASFFFVRSSPRLHGWLCRSPTFGPLIRDWDDHRAIRRPAKIMAIVMIVLVIASSLLVAPLTPWLQALLVGLGLIGLIVVGRLPVIREEPEA